MNSSRHPLPESDFGFTIKLIKTNVQRARHDTSAVIECRNEVTINNRTTTLYRAKFPPNKGFINHIIHIYLDAALDLPAKIEMYDWNGTLIESYLFANLKINTGLNEMDFDAENPAYKF